LTCVGLRRAGIDGDWKSRMSAEEVIDIPPAHDQVRRFAHSAAELVALPYRHRIESADAEVVWRVKAGRPEVRMTIVCVLPISAVRVHAAAAIVSEIIGQGLRERVGG